MARIRIPLANWPLKLHSALAYIADGDTLILPDERVREAARVQTRAALPGSLGLPGGHEKRGGGS